MKIDSAGFEFGGWWPKCITWASKKLFASERKFSMREARFLYSGYGAGGRGFREVSGVQASVAG